MRGPHAALSPTFGAPATPAWWQAAQVLLNTSSPLLPPAAPPPPPPSSTCPTGWMRFATACGVSAFGSAPRSLVTSCTSRMMPMTGTANDATMTATSCCGVLMNDECESESWVATAVLLRKALILGYPAPPSSARSSAGQSIGLRSQGSWVRIPPGAPASLAAIAFQPGLQPLAHARAVRRRDMRRAGHEPERLRLRGAREKPLRVARRHDAVRLAVDEEERDRAHRRDRALRRVIVVDSERGQPLQRPGQGEAGELFRSDAPVIGERAVGDERAHAI